MTSPIRLPGEGRDPGAAAATPWMEPFYNKPVRSGVWPLGPGLRREGVEWTESQAHAR
ncbi:MAG: hypothetical protein ACT6Q8_16445 [Niveispirillum sp.]|uniref:hypothetical protein n=1 Tax=Niveispirillum sp. TaxID=1917217 RepID=UPI0012E32B4A